MTKASVVGPVLIADATGRSIAQVIVHTNPGATLIDRGSYLRVSVPERCVLTCHAIRTELGQPFKLPEDLERIMPAFSGSLTITDEEVLWQSPLQSAAKA